MSYYLLKPPLTTQDRLTIYPFFKLDLSFSQISFFHSAAIEWSNLDYLSKTPSIFKV